MKIDGMEVKEGDSINFIGISYDLNWYRKILIWLRIKKLDDYKINNGIWQVTSKTEQIIEKTNENMAFQRYLDGHNTLKDIIEIIKSTPTEVLLEDKIIETNDFLSVMTKISYGEDGDFHVLFSGFLKNQNK